jgi:hypothetical protein
VNDLQSGPRPAHDEVAQLRQERRSYIIGSLVVWAVIWITVLILVASMLPSLPVQPKLSDAINELAKASPSSRLLLDLVVLVGAIALFFLNWRFSVLLRRPRGAFGSPPGTFSSGRWIWWVVLALNSMFYVSLIVPQLIVTAVLARWGNEEILRRSAPPPPRPEV